MRTQGTFNFGANLEVKKDAPLDSRALVPSYSDLTLDEAWKDSDGNAWTYPGMVVTCLDKPGKLYQLTASDYTKTANWKEIGADVDLSKYALKEEVPNGFNITTGADDVTIALSRNDTEDIGSDYSIPVATTTGAGVMSATDKANLDRMQVEEGGSFSVDHIDGVLFQVPNEEGNVQYEVQVNDGHILSGGKQYGFPTTSGRLALTSDITTAVSSKADASALAALEEKVADVPTSAMDETDINTICK